MKWYLAALKKYATFSGRAQRSEYWYFVLFNILIAFAIGFVGGVLSSVVGASSIVVVSAIYNLAVLIPSLAVFFRRLHDTGRSGWWWLIGLIPVVGWIVILIFMVQDSQPGGNEYGPNPKDGSGAAEGGTAGAKAASGGIPKVALFAIAGVVGVFLVGMIAAIALPAYQDYQKRAAQAEAKMKSPAPAPAPAQEVKAPPPPAAPVASAPPPVVPPPAAPAVASIPEPAKPAPVVMEEPVKAKTVVSEEPKAPQPAAVARMQKASAPLKAAPLPCVYKPVMTDEDLARCR
jgi:uncharacterized membrane protein YhaH (DUF805 family)